MLYKSTIAVSVALGFAAWQQNHESLESGSKSIYSKNLPIKSFVGFGNPCNVVPVDMDNKQTPNKKEDLPDNSVRIDSVPEALGPVFTDHPLDGVDQSVFKFSINFDAALANCFLSSEVVSNGGIRLTLSGANCGYSIVTALIKGGNANVAEYYDIAAAGCEDVKDFTGYTLTNQAVSNYVVGFALVADSSEEADPIIHTFDGVEYQVVSEGAFLNTRWHGGKHAINSCFYRPDPRSTFTRAVSYQCGNTILMYHLAKSTLDNWKREGLSQQAKMNVYYFNRETHQLLQGTGDFGSFAPTSGEYTDTVSAVCPLDKAKVALKAFPHKSKWQWEKGMAMLNAEIVLIPGQDGKLPEVEGGLSQSLSGNYTGPAMTDGGSSRSAESDAKFFFPGPNTNGKVCDERGIKFVQALIQDDDCGIRSWSLAKEDNIFNILAEGNNEAHVLACNLGEGHQH